MRSPIPSRKKVWAWTKRYLPQELCGLSAAMLVAFFYRAALRSGHDIAVLVVICKMAGADALVYYTYGFFRELIHHVRVRNDVNLILVPLFIVRDMVIEYWAVDVVDTLFIRPTCLCVGVMMTGNLFVGTVLGYIVANIAFNMLAAPCFELRKRLFNASAPIHHAPAAHNLEERL
jgi:hypothetical protein